MSEHTPGPWEAIASTSFPGRYLIAQPRSKTPVLAVADTIEVAPAEEKANARLLAAAPELLEMLDDAAEAFEALAVDFKASGDIGESEAASGFGSCCREAIAQARGDA